MLSNFEAHFHLIFSPLLFHTLVLHWLIFVFLISIYNPGKNVCVKVLLSNDAWKKTSISTFLQFWTGIHQSFLRSDGLPAAIEASAPGLFIEKMYVSLIARWEQAVPNCRKFSENNDHCCSYLISNNINRVPYKYRWKFTKKSKWC